MMSVRVAAPPAVELKELAGPLDKPPAASAVASSVASSVAPGPCSPLHAEPGPAPAPPGSAAAAKAPQASAMKRCEQPPLRLTGDGGDGAGGQLAEALVSPDGTVTEAPRTVKKVKRARGRGDLPLPLGTTGPIVPCLPPLRPGEGGL
uniref:Uncharacterized protein n=1 Tax=Laticauda laticaudata TaxID=8630 RepID=A0A8C5WQS9_LATLA